METEQDILKKLVEELTVIFDSMESTIKQLKARAKLNYNLKQVEALKNEVSRELSIFSAAFAAANQRWENKMNRRIAELKYKVKR